MTSRRSIAKQQPSVNQSVSHTVFTKSITIQHIHRAARRPAAGATPRARQSSTSSVLSQLWYITLIYQQPSNLTTLSALTTADTMLECNLLPQSLISKNFYAAAAALLSTTILSLRPLYCNFTCHFMKPTINENIYEQQVVMFSCQVSVT